MAIDWKGIRRGFERGKSAAGLARGYGGSAQTIRTRANREKWKKMPGEPAGMPVDEGSLDNRRVLNGVRKRLVNGLENEDVKQGIEELKAAKIAWEVLSEFMKEEKLSLGLEEGGDEDGDERRAVASAMAEATAPSGTDKALEGE